MKKVLITLLSVFLVLALLVAGAWGGKYYFEQNYVLLGEKPYRRDVTELDLSGVTAPDLDTVAELKQLKKLNLQNTGLTLGEYEWLKSRLPECEIAWEVLFQGEYLRPDLEKLSLSHLSLSDTVTLDYLPALREIDARECKDYEALGALILRRPDCRILCEVELAGEQWDQDTRGMTLSGAESEELEKGLPALTKLETVVLTEPLPSLPEITELQAQFPEVAFSWLVQLGENSYPGDTVSLDLSGETLGENFAEKLSWFPGLRTLDLRGCLISQDVRDRIKEKYPEVELLWDVDLHGHAANAETTLLDLSGTEGIELAEIEAVLPYLPNLQKLILSGCGLENEALDQLDQKYPKVRIVWTVNIAGRDTRTDETYFTPNKWGLTLEDRTLENIKYCRDMVCVDIGHNRKVTHCRWAENMPELTYLILADTAVRDLEPLRDHPKLKYMELFLTPAMDYSPLTSLTALEDLNLCYCYGDPDPIGEMPWLKRLWWTHNWKAQSTLPEKLPDTQLEFASPSSTGKGWREGPLYFEMRDYIGMEYMTG